MQSYAELDHSFKEAIRLCREGRNGFSPNESYPFTGVEEFDIEITGMAYDTKEDFIDENGEYISIPKEKVEETVNYKLYHLNDDKLIEHINCECKKVDKLISKYFKPKYYNNNKWFLVGIVYYIEFNNLVKKYGSFWSLVQD